jgi:NADPH:quinone reductase-like Zn-dependent oxidoreductase
MPSASEYKRKVFHRFGAPEVFQWEPLAIPNLKSDEVLIRVKFSGVNYADIIARRGYYKWAGALPICVGFEVAGEIIDKGESVALPIGTKVLAVTKFGGYSEAVVTEQNRVWQIPAGMSLEEAAAMPAVYLTAYHSLMEVMRIRRGEDILIQAVAGGVGIAALQIAKHIGLTVYGTASTEEKLQFARMFGLDFGINYVREDFEIAMRRLTANRGVKFLLDSLGGNGLRKGMRCLKPMGHAVTIGAAGIVPPYGVNWNSAKEWKRIAGDFMRGGIYHPFYLIERNISLSGVQVLLLWDELEYFQRVMRELIAWYEAGVIKPHVDAVFPLDQAAEAHRFVEQRRSKGKVLLTTDIMTWQRG